MPIRSFSQTPQNPREWGKFFRETTVMADAVDENTAGLVEAIEDATAALIRDGVGITWVYNDAPTPGTLTGTVSLSPFSTSNLAEGTNLYYTAARFNTAFAAKTTTDLTEGLNLYYTDVRARAAISISDTASVDLTYAGGVISAVVLPAGVNHNSLLNYVADQHVAHTGVTLTAGAGLTGGGDISATRTFAVGAGTGITVNADDVAVNLSATFAWSGVHNWSVRQQVFGTTTANIGLVTGLADTGVSVHNVEQLRVHRVGGEPFITIQRLNTSYAAPSALVSGNSAGSIAWGGYDGTTMQPTSAQIFLDITETWSGTARGGNLRFQTTTTGSTTKTDRLQIGADSTGGFVKVPDGVVGQVGLGFITDADTGLYRIGTNSFGAATAGAVAMSWDSSQNTLGKAAIRSDSATGGVGYATGAGGTVTQITSRTTGVTLNKVCGAITLFSAAGSATSTKFTVTNSAVAATDTVVMTQQSGTDDYEISTRAAAGSFAVIFRTTGGTTVEQPVFNFAVVKAVSA